MTGALRRFPVFGSLPWVVGVLNVTPDSFSDGGRWDTTEDAVARGRQLIADGAQLVDVGGESTRPGANRVDVPVERGRVLPVITELAAEGILCSIDTTRAAVAAAAIDAGALLVNDVSGGRADPDMARVVSGAEVPWVLMHWRGHSDVMQHLARYRNVVIDVRDELMGQVDAALAAGVDERALILDPGLGFAKNSAHNWDLIDALPELLDLGLPVLIGASRKRFLGELLRTDDGVLRPPSGRDVATAATSLLAAQAGVWGVRVHEPRPTLDAMLVGTLGRPLAAQDQLNAVAPGPLVVHDGRGFTDGGRYRVGALRQSAAGHG
jgi:dihydropteroate synthase